MKLVDLLEASVPTHEPNLVGDLNLSHHELKMVPSDLPRYISGFLDLSGNKITNLLNCPKDVKHSFLCSHCKLTSLFGGPTTVGGSYFCSENRLKDLRGIPEKLHRSLIARANRISSLQFFPEYVGRDVDLAHNNLRSLKGFHDRLHHVGGDIDLSNNGIKSHVLSLMLIHIEKSIITDLGHDGDVARILNRWKNQGRKGVLGAQRELLDLGYEELAQL
jgi:hypothetical protein